jgi:hypothetical protein
MGAKIGRSVPSNIPKEDVGRFEPFTREAGGSAPIAAAVEKTFQAAALRAKLSY